MTRFDIALKNILTNTNPSSYIEYGSYSGVLGLSSCFQNITCELFEKRVINTLTRSSVNKTICVSSLKIKIIDYIKIIEQQMILNLIDYQMEKNGILSELVLMSININNIRK